MLCFAIHTVNFKGYRSPRTRLLITQNARAITNGGGWTPKFGMVDKDRAEINSLKTGKHLSHGPGVTETLRTIIGTPRHVLVPNVKFLGPIS